jgi:O-antigen ligase
VFGMGFGFPLIDFVAHGPGYAEEGQVAREPHNSYVSIVSRLGLIGILTFAWMHVLLLGVWRRTYTMCQRLHWREGQNRLLILMVYCVVIWVAALGEDAFEKPFATIPYYFFWGVVLSMSYRLRHLSREDASEYAVSTSGRSTTSTELGRPKP